MMASGISDLAALTHDVAARGLFQPLYRLERWIRPSQRAAIASFYAGMRLRRRSASWSPDEKRAWILCRLRRVARRAWEDTPYYRELFERIGFDPRADFSFDDYARVPTLDRHQVEAAGESLLSRSVPSQLVRQDATGGSTGQPTLIWTGPEERGWRESGIEHYMRGLGVPRGSRIGLLWGHHLDPVASDHLLDRLRAIAGNLRWYDCLRLSAERLREYHQQLQRYKPRCLIAYASALGALAMEIDGGTEAPAYPTRCFVTGGEKLLKHHRETIERVFAKPVHERYGTRDVGMIGFQAGVPRTLAYEIDWVNVMVEPESGEANSPILITKLHADAMPMLRYRIGDLGTFPAGSATGHPALSLEEVIGRETDGIQLPDGRWVHGIAFPHLMKDYPVKEFQIEQREDFSVIIRLVLRSGFSEEDRQEIEQLLGANLPGLRLTFQQVERIQRSPSNKWRPVISKVMERRRGSGA